jgi:hypothetical protein
LILPRKAGRAIAVAHILQSDESPGEDLGERPSNERENSLEPPAKGANGQGDDREASREHNAANAEERFRSDVDKSFASHQLLEQYDYVLTWVGSPLFTSEVYANSPAYFSLTEDQRLCSWLEEMALDKIVTISVGEKRRGTRWRIADRADVQGVLAAFASSVEEWLTTVECAD